jgi:uncharacterized protein
MRFYDREAEMEELTQLGKKRPSFAVITGRRRVGKTELITQYLGGGGLYFFVDGKKSELLLAKEFSDILRSGRPKCPHN